MHTIRHSSNDTSVGTEPRLGTVLDRPDATAPPQPPVETSTASNALEPRPVPYRCSPRKLFLAVRPHQWIKNALVMVAPIVTGAVLHRSVLIAGMIAVAAFCAASAATYLVNDLADIDADKLHPTKQLRPIAAGTLSVDDARTAAVVFGCASFGLALGLGPVFVAVLFIYLFETTLYSHRLKHIAVVDVLTVAAGFVLRVVAGAVAVGTGVSPWLVGSVAAGAVLISLGKRHAEVGRLGTDAGDHRAVLDWYRPTRTNAMMVGTETVAVISTGLWFATTFGATIAIAAVAAVALILERFRRLVLAGDVDDPVRVVTHDRPIAAACVVLGAVLFAAVML